MSAHFSITTKVSGPRWAWDAGPSGASTAGPYSMHPASASTAGTLARKACSTASR